MSERSRRKRKSINNNVSNIHYVGYVEDQESVEAIMKKFEELERIKSEFAVSRSGIVGSNDISSSTMTDSGEGSSKEKDFPGEASKLPEDEGLSEEQLEEIFKRTSAFTVKTAMMDEFDDMDEKEIWQLQLADGNTEEFEEEYDYIAVDDEFWDMEFGDKSRKRVRRKEARPVRKPDREKALARYKIMQVQIQDRDGNFHVVKKKVSIINPSLPTYVKIPPSPMPYSWGHTILPYPPTEKEILGSRYHVVPSITNTDLRKFGTKFQAVYMDPPLLLPGEEPVPGKITIEQFRTLKISAIVPKGFLFIWLEKEHTPEILRAADAWGFKYVENFCWIKKNANNTIARAHFKYFCKSKLSLLIFRKEGDIELRHQRNPDCVFDFIKPRQEGELTEEKPRFIYHVIETLLPQAGYGPNNKDGGGLLELWAKMDTRRQGWTTVVQSQETVATSSEAT